jgi:hypothetical protein
MAVRDGSMDAKGLPTMAESVFRRRRAERRSIEMAFSMVHRMELSVQSHKAQRDRRRFDFQDQDYARYT